MKIYLIRHGITEYNEQHRYLGRSDIPLSVNGREALTSVGKPLPDGNFKVYVSGLKRTRQTAEILFPQAEIVVNRGLDEMDFGIFEGHNYEEMQDNPEYQKWVDSYCTSKCPDGESKEEYCNRVKDAFMRIIKTNIDAKELVIVAHGGTQMAIMEAFGIEDLSDGSSAKGYYEWQLPNGQGYILDCMNYQKSDKFLKVLGIADYTK